MKTLKNTLILAFLLFCFSASGQNMVQNVDITLFVKELAPVRQPIADFLKKNPQISLLRYEESKPTYGSSKTIVMEVVCDEKNGELLESQLAVWGFVDGRQISTVNNTFEMDKRKMELVFLKKRMETYQKELDLSQRNSEQYERYFLEIRKLEDQIFRLEKDITELAQQVSNYNYKILFQEENSTPQNSNIAFINMPGIQYGFMKLENPTANFSASSYQGLSLKYMFTRGKSFVEIGAYRNVDKLNETDSSTISELFIYSFGQDFYPTRFGRGKRRFLNLYTGYVIGGVFATSTNSSHHFVQITPHFGIELFKSRSILLDTNVGYFIPFYQNRSLRGWSANVAFNFLF